MADDPADRKRLLPPDPERDRISSRNPAATILRSRGPISQPITAESVRLSAMKSAMALMTKVLNSMAMAT
jgi:hypothetical protein